MSAADQILIFTLDEKRYAIHLQTVERVVTAVEITPLPEATESVVGVINVHGVVMPVLNIRRKFRLPERNIEPDDSIVIVKGSKCLVAFVVDAVEGVIERSAHEIIPADNLLPHMAYTEGLITLDGEILIIHDIDKALSVEEIVAIKAAE
jgi:purine-binding chemotaxis protein CheW